MKKLFTELAAAPLAKRLTIPVPRQREHRSKPSSASGGMADVGGSKNGLG